VRNYWYLKVQGSVDEFLLSCLTSRDKGIWKDLEVVEGVRGSWVEG
jgi:hypothetical protein